MLRLLLGSVVVLVIGTFLVLVARSSPGLFLVVWAIVTVVGLSLTAWVVGDELVALLRKHWGQQ